MVRQSVSTITYRFPFFSFLCWCGCLRTSSCSSFSLTTVGAQQLESGQVVKQQVVGPHSPQQQI